MAFMKIDMESFPRKSHFEYFLNMAYPYAGVTVKVDVTDFVRFCNEKKCSFYLAFLHAAALAADSVREFRFRIRDGGIAEYDACPTSHIEILNDETYCYCTLRHHMPFDEYLEKAENARKLCREKGGIEEDNDVESMYFVSCLPWLDYTSLVQPVSGGEDSNPRITWGRYASDAEGRLAMPVSVLVHHALADGVHIAKFYDALNRQMKILSEEV